MKLSSETGQFTHNHARSLDFMGFSRFCIPFRCHINCGPTICSFQRTVGILHVGSLSDILNMISFSEVWQALHMCGFLHRQKKAKRRKQGIKVEIG